MIKHNFTTYKGIATAEFQLAWVIWSVMSIWDKEHWEGYVSEDAIAKLKAENPEGFKMSRQELMAIIQSMKNNQRLVGTITKLTRLTSFRKELIRRLPQNNILRWFMVPTRTTNLSELAFEYVKELFGLFDWAKLRPIVSRYVAQPDTEIEAGQLPNIMYRDIMAARQMQLPRAMERILSDKIAHIETIVNTPSPIRDFDDLKHINSSIKIICTPIK